MFCLSTCQWTLGLLPPLSCCEEGSCEDGCANTSSRPCPQFFWVHAWKWNRWIIQRCWVFLFLYFLRNCLPVFWNGCTILHPHQQCTRVPTSAHPAGTCGGVYREWDGVHVSDSSHADGCEWYLTEVWICISLVIRGWASFHVLVAHLCVSSLDKGPLSPLPIL